MRWRGITLGILALLASFWLSACNASHGRLEGALRDARSGNPVPGGEIRLGNQVIAADEQGRFRAMLPFGAYEAHAAAPGYVVTSFAFALGEGSRRLEREILLHPRLLRGQAVFDDTGEPVSEGQVQYGEDILALQADGSFEVWVRDARDLWIVCVGCIPFTLSADEVEAAFDADGNLKAPLVARIAPLILQGVVREPTGVPIPGIMVRLGEQEVSTDAQGRFQFRRPYPQDSLSVSSPAHRPLEPIPYTGQAVQEIVLQPWEAVIRVKDQETSLPLEGALVSSPLGEGVTDAEGQARVHAVPGSEVVVTAHGYLTATIAYQGEEMPLEVPLKPTGLWGTLTDKSTGTPIARALVQVFRRGKALPELLRTNEGGAFEISDASEVERLYIKAPGYQRLEVPVERLGRLALALEPFEVRGIYIPLALLSLPDRIYALLDMVAASPTLNAVVIDVKGDWAVTAWESDVPVAREIDTSLPGLMDIEEVLKACRERGIYTIARIVVFKDRLLAEAKPEWAVRTQSGALYRDGEGLYWADPFRHEVWDYNIGLALEAIAKGFDEVQFDYLRFPSEGRVSDRVYSQESTLESRTQAIRDFCAAAYRAIEPTPAFLSADIFGLTVWVDPSRDMGIGQRLEDIASHVDYLSPMLYPSTFNPANLQHLGINHVERAPYETIYYSVRQAMKRTQTKIRPWLQHYSGSVPYGVEELLLQRKGAEDAGSCGWLFWNAGAKYREEVFGADPYHLLSRIPEPPAHSTQE